MEKELKHLLDKTYELEGLVHLALKRSEEVDEFLRLISNKGKEIGNICDSIYQEGKSKDLEVKQIDPYFSFDEYSIDDEKISDNMFSDTFSSVSTEDNTDRKEVTKSGKLVFSINDKYRYKKELFNNSDVEFNNTLALIASMENFEEAEDYFINEVGFDYANPVVKEFLGILKKYFQ